MATSYRKPSPLDPGRVLVFQPEKDPPSTKERPVLKDITALHDIPEIVKQVPELFPRGGTQKIEPGATHTLSARTPWIEHVGWIETLHSLASFPTNPSYEFSVTPEVPDEYRQATIWLEELSPGSSYIVQLRLRGFQEGQYLISTGEGGRQQAPGGNTTIPVLLYQVARSISLVRVMAQGIGNWALIDATITAIPA